MLKNGFRICPRIDDLDPTLISVSPLDRRLTDFVAQPSRLFASHGSFFSSRSVPPSARSCFHMLKLTSFAHHPRLYYVLPFSLPPAPHHLPPQKKQKKKPRPPKTHPPPPPPPPSPPPPPPHFPPPPTPPAPLSPAPRPAD